MKTEAHIIHARQLARAFAEATFRSHGYTFEDKLLNGMRRESEMTEGEQDLRDLASAATDVLSWVLGDGHTSFDELLDKLKE